MDCPPNLRYTTDESQGISRKRRGKGFSYYDSAGNRIIDKASLGRIAELAIPPGWQNVWISPDENAHLQVTGHDQQRRKQYIYHPDWVAYRQNHKFEKLSSFGRLLPLIRQAVAKDLAKRNWPREKVLALVVHLMDNYYFRVGQKRYARQNKSYGVATLRRKHIHEEHGSLMVRYEGKSGQVRSVRIGDKRISRKIKQLSELPGYELFRYQGGDKTMHTIDACDINDYLQQISGARITAKDFRTWGGTKLAITFYEEVCRELQEKKRRKFETSLVRKVSRCLGNTVSVCRRYYIHPKVLDMLENRHRQNILSLGLEDDSEEQAEAYLLDFLDRVLIEGKTDVSPFTGNAANQKLLS